MPSSQIIGFSNATLNDNQTRYSCPAHTLNNNTGALIQASEMNVRDAGTFDKAFLYINSNTVTAQTDISFFLNRTGTGIQLVIGADQTGAFEDTTHSAVATATDEATWEIVCGNEAGTNTLNVRLFAIRFTPTSGSDTVHWGYTGGSGMSISTASVTRFLAPTGTITADASEDNAKARILGTFTAKRLGFEVQSNARTTDTVVRTRINGANGNQSVTVGSTQTGVFEDTSNTDSIASGDDFDYSVTTGTGTGTLNTNWCCAILVSASRQWVYYPGACNGLAVSAVGGTDQYAALSANLAQATTTEAHTQYVARFDHTLSNFAARVSANNVSTTTVVRTRVNGSNGTCELSIGSSQTGLFTDTTHSDSVTAGQTANIQIDMTNGTGTISFRVMTLRGETSAPAVDFVPFPRPRGLYGGMGSMTGGMH